MKLNKVSAAVAASMLLAAPMVSMADGGFYGSVRIGLSYADDGDNSTIQFRNWASRMGYSGEKELENGLTAFGKYEFQVDTNSRDLIADLTTRKAYVGLRGNFGQFLIGQNYHTYYNNVIAPVDQPWWQSCNGCLAYTGRKGNGLTYEGTFGFFKGGATVYLEPDAASEGGEDDLDGIELGGTFDVGAVKIGVGVQDLADDDDPTIGIVVSGKAGPITYASNAAVNGDILGVDVFLGFSSFYVDLGIIDNDVNTASGFTFGYTLGIGESTLAWFEASLSDTGISGDDLNTNLRAALKYDWK